MQYTDNPRKIYGKVKVIYADSETSKEMQVSTSGNGKISHPNDVYKGYLSPSIKACTMDGNSTMGGSFQMNGNNFVNGWWSDVHSDSNGNFATSPTLTINFTARPVGSWIVLGDNKLNQYPINFYLEFYSGETKVKTLEINNNIEVNKRILLDEFLEDITSIKLIIKKWNKPNAKAKILQFFDIMQEEYLGKDLKEFEVLEELNGEIENSSYGINSDTTTIKIYNKNRKFDKGYLRSLLLLGRKVIPYIGIENNLGEIEYISLGTFYSSSWNVPLNEPFITLTATDKLLSFQKLTYVGYPLTDNVSIYDIAIDVLTKAGLKENEYIIDEKLKEDIIYKGYLRKCNIWEALQEICNGVNSYCYINRENKVVIEKENIIDNGYTINKNEIFSLDIKTRNTDFCNYIEVSYSDITENIELVTVFEKAIVLDKNEKLTMKIDYNEDIASASISYLPSINLELISFESGINAGKFAIKNTSEDIITTTVKIQGNSVNIQTQTVIVEDKKSIDQWGKLEYVYAGSELIQSLDKAMEIGNKLLKSLNMGGGSIAIKWRGNPNLALKEKVKVIDRFNDSYNLVLSHNLYKFDGGLIQESKGIKSN